MNRVALLLACVALVAGPSRSRADDSDDARASARIEFDAGQAAAASHDYDGAIAHYLKANEIVPHAFNLYNVAVNYEKLGRLRDAVTYYEAYLEALPNAPDLARVTQLIAELRTKSGMLTVRTIPEGARVTLDGSNVGTTPFSAVTRGGLHQVIVEAGGKRQAQAITVEYGEPSDVQITLSGTSGTLSVVGNPLGAQVAIDGRILGLLPAKLVVAPGSHSVEVSSYGYAPFDATVDVRAGDTVPVQAYLQRAAETTGTTSGGLAATTPATAGYILGFGGGADVNGPGSLAYGEFGYRLLNYSGLFQFGKAGGTTLIGLIVRWSVRPGRISPILGAGLIYDYASSDDTGTGSGSGSAMPQSETGLEIEGGIRASLFTGPHFDVSLLATVMAKLYKSTDSNDNESSGLSFPVMLTLEASSR